MIKSKDLESDESAALPSGFRTAIIRYPSGARYLVVWYGALLCGQFSRTTEGYCERTHRKRRPTLAEAVRIVMQNRVRAAKREAELYESLDATLKAWVKNA